MTKLPRKSDLQGLSDEDFRRAFADVVALQRQDRMESNISYYEPASAPARRIHESSARIIGVGGGNRSGKSETVLAHLAALATGILPDSVRDDLLPKFRGPVHVRICIESLTTVLHPIILPKLKWWVWTGIDQPGGERGHYGWIPRLCLRENDWEKSWSEKLRTLTVLCRDPEEPEKVLGESLLQFMSYDQDPSDFASGTFHHVMHDEPPTAAIWRENRARTLDVNGTTYVVMTWPDDPAISVDFIFDEVYEPGQAGPNKSSEIDWINLRTVENRNLDAEGVLSMAASWDAQTRSVRLEGQPLRFSNRIHPLFSDIPQVWSFAAREAVSPIDGLCPATGSPDIEVFNHVANFDIQPFWPAVLLLDPHPRKPHMLCWACIDPSDDVWIVAEGVIPGDCGDVRRFVDDAEERYGISTMLRLMDPNMGASPSSTKRNVTWQDDFDRAGLRFDLADDSAVGRQTLNSYLRPDEHTRRPRLTVHPRCETVIFQLKRHVWGEFKSSTDRDKKQVPKDKYDDFPALLKYLMNARPNFTSLRSGSETIQYARVGR